MSCGGYRGDHGSETMSERCYYTNPTSVCGYGGFRLVRGRLMFKRLNFLSLIEPWLHPLFLGPEFPQTG